ncbi:MAG: hypothetical protein LBS72_00860 [Oscillospiraceae bacterium]|nr:hypothetical protein [Oscillospiraceae bacterium]
MKRKFRFSMAIVLALVLVASIAAALALNSWFDTGRTIIETQQKFGEYDGYGDYQYWTISEKTSLVKTLVEQGAIEKTGDIEDLLSGALSAEKAVQVADQALVEFTGRALIDISFAEIMEGAWGPMDLWTYEQSAWYSEIMHEVAGVEKDGHTFYVVPKDNKIDEAEAIAIAKNAIVEGFNKAGYGLEMELLDKYYETRLEFQLPEDRPIGDELLYWYIEFTATPDIPLTKQLFNKFRVFVNSETGELRKSVEQIMLELPRIPMIYKESR